jgi:hypothetical protein
MKLPALAGAVAPILGSKGVSDSERLAPANSRNENGALQRDHMEPYISALFGPDRALSGSGAFCLFPELSQS